MLIFLFFFAIIMLLLGVGAATFDKKHLNEQKTLAEMISDKLNRKK